MYFPWIDFANNSPSVSAIDNSASFLVYMPLLSAYRKVTIESMAPNLGNDVAYINVGNVFTEINTFEQGAVLPHGIWMFGDDPAIGSPYNKLFRSFNYDIEIGSNLKIGQIDLPVNPGIIVFTNTPVTSAAVQGSHGPLFAVDGQPVFSCLGDKDNNSNNLQNRRLKSYGGFQYGVTNVNSTSSFDYGHHYIFADTSTGSYMIEIPDGVSLGVNREGSEFIIRNTNVNTVSVSGKYSGLIDNIIGGIITITNNGYVRLMSNGSGWHTLDKNNATVS